MQDRANLPMRTESAPLQRNDALYRARGAYNFGKGVDFRHNAPRANFPARPPLGAMATSAGAAGPNATTMPPPPSSSAAGAGGVNHRGTPPTNNATEEGHKSSTTPSQQQQQQISSEAMDGRAAGTPNRGNGASASEANVTGAYGHPSSLTLEESEEGPTRHVTAMMGGHAHHLRNSPQRPQQQQQQQQPSGAWSQSLSRASSGEHQPHHNINSNNGAANVGMQGANTTEQGPEHRGSEMHQHHYDPESQSRVYSVNQLLRLQNSQHPVPEAILNCARSLWKEMPEHVDEIPQNSFLRDNLFKGGNITMPSKLLVERKLHNEVMGILGKVTESNIEVMKNELTALPIRQSTEDEIRQVIHVFFNKSTRPEDSRYTPLYVQLIAHLINTIGTHERAGKMIRVEVLSQCRTTFMNAAGEAKMVEEKVAKLPDTEANLLRMQFTSKQKANIYFLSQMFLAHLVSETVVLAVLDNLLYGEGRRRRVPPDYCIVHFIELMQTCGPYLDKPFYEKTFPRYYQVMLDLSQNYPQKRIQFLLQNFLDTINNNWVPVHGPGAKLGAAAAAPHGRPVTTPLLAKAAGRSGAGTPALLMTSPTAVHGLGGEPRPKIPDREEFWRVMDDFFATSEIEDIVKVIANIPMPVLEAYCSQWIGRYITTYRYTQERTRLGELFEKLVSRNAFTVKNVRDALDKHIQNAIAEDLFTDQPRYFELWAVVIKNGRSIFPSFYHTKLLNALVDNRTSKEIVVKMIMDVHKVLDEPGNGNRTEQKEYNAQDRFRVLSALLRYIPPLLEAEAPAEDDESILDDVRDVDVEVNFFLTLCESYDEGRHAATMSTVLDALKKSHTNAYPLISAYFTFVRFDVDALCTSYKDVLKKLLAIRTPASLLEEVYVQWQALDCPESYYFAFVKKALATMTSTKGDPLEKLRERLRTEYGADKLLVQLDKYLK